MYQKTASDSVGETLSNLSCSLCVIEMHQAFRGKGVGTTMGQPLGHRKRPSLGHHTRGTPTVDSGLPRTPFSLLSDLPREGSGQPLST